ncbi:MULTISPECIES: IS66-like element accessory protein TnpA [Brucella/Ochrobactrum group]|uniref:IS66-like element accessory protein TnpA n=1 Tax=Brucella/Ochrobactrum group TaxID=2826938 RepID=UPI000EFA4650|nr:transposase [Brucella intermedia]KAB2689884.1 transposase [Brucella intermedia]MCI1003072.1 transposase [Ochrobactrum sp. C6C9]
MVDGDGFAGRLDIVDPRGGYRRWTTEMKARIVAESLHPGARVVEVAQRYDLSANQLSYWRKQARDGHLILPAELMPSVPDVEGCEPAFVALSIADEPEMPAVTSSMPETAVATAGIVTIEINADLVVKVPGDVPVSRVAALVGALRGLA